MAGYMYLGNKKVCPAILVGGQPEPPEYDSLLKIPDDVTELVQSSTYNFPLFKIDTGFANSKVLLDLNNVERVGNGSNIGGVLSAAFAQFLKTTMPLINTTVNIKAEKLRVAGNFCFYSFVQYVFPREKAFYSKKLTFPSLEEIGSRCFNYFSPIGVEEIYFPKLKIANSNSFANMLTDILGPITLHFASNQESLISSLTGYPNFGSEYSVTILYDQPPTE